MSPVLAYGITVLIIVVSVFLSLNFNAERRRKYIGKKAIVFHLYNVLFICMASSVLHFVMTVYFFEIKSTLIPQIVFLLSTSISFYILGYIVLEHYKFIVTKYEKAENGKVLILNRAYLRRK